jgi:hypothetical protein
MATPHSFVEITCPDTGRPITVAMSFRDDPIGQLYASNQISQHQRAAADAYQADLESGHLRALSRGPEDCSGWRARRPDNRNRKHDQRLQRAAVALGADQTALVRQAMAGRKVDIRKLAPALNILAEVYGLATRH